MQLLSCGTVHSPARQDEKKERKRRIEKKGGVTELLEKSVRGVNSNCVLNRVASAV